MARPGPSGLRTKCLRHTRNPITPPVATVQRPARPPPTTQQPCADLPERLLRKTVARWALLPLRPPRRQRASTPRALPPGRGAARLPRTRVEEVEGPPRRRALPTTALPQNRTHRAPPGAPANSATGRARSAACTRRPPCAYSRARAPAAMLRRSGVRAPTAPVATLAASAPRGPRCHREGTAPPPGCAAARTPPSPPARTRNPIPPAPLRPNPPPPAERLKAPRAAPTATQRPGRRPWPARANNGRGHPPRCHRCSPSRAPTTPAAGGCTTSQRTCPDAQSEGRMGKTPLAAKRTGTAAGDPNAAPAAARCACHHRHTHIRRQHMRL